MERAGLIGQETGGQFLPPGDRVRRPVLEDELVWVGDEPVGRDLIGHAIAPNGRRRDPRVVARAVWLRLLQRPTRRERIAVRRRFANLARVLGDQATEPRLAHQPGDTFLADLDVMLDPRLCVDPAGTIDTTVSHVDLLDLLDQPRV